jgi:hypothetical protein
MENYIRTCTSTGVDLPEAQSQQAEALIKCCEEHGRANTQENDAAFDLTAALIGESRMLLGATDAALGGEWARKLAGL